MGMTGWAGRGYTGTPPSTIPGSHITVYLRYKPYPRPNEGLLRCIDEVSQIGSRIGSQIASELTQNDPRIDPPGLVPRWPPDDPPDP